MRTKRFTLLAAMILTIATTFSVNMLTASPAAADACYTWSRTLSSGMSGSDVTQLQKRIAGWVSYGENLALDGQYGPATTAAVKRFQSGYGLSVDGIAGSQTFSKLYALQDDDCTPIHFSHYEMNNNCGAHNYEGGAVSAATAKENALRVMWQLEAVRHKLGDRAMVVTSGFRSYACNSSRDRQGGPVRRLRGDPRPRLPRAQRPRPPGEPGQSVLERLELRYLTPVLPGRPSPIGLPGGVSRQEAIVMKTRSPAGSGRSAPVRSTAPGHVKLIFFNWRTGVTAACRFGGLL